MGRKEANLNQRTLLKSRKAAKKSINGCY